eukprot:5016225-Prorocentrum_lima.AAC.1
MTSSLVGSEMCIRDSILVSVPTILPGLGIVETGTVWKIRRVVYGLKAVSYTHLTLPTICSV